MSSRLEDFHKEEIENRKQCKLKVGSGDELTARWVVAWRREGCLHSRIPGQSTTGELAGGLELDRRKEAADSQWNPGKSSCGADPREEQFRWPGGCAWSHQWSGVSKQSAVAFLLRRTSQKLPC